jgi:uncharacterized membrane protein YfcA
VITDPIFWYVAIPAVIALGLSKGGFSGIGAMATPLLALVVSPVQAAGVLLPILLAQDAVTVWAYRRTWDRWNLAVMVPGLVLGVALGWLMAAFVSDAYVRIAVGTIAAGFTVNHWLGRMPAPAGGRPPIHKGVFWGGAAGFTTFLAHAGGPPFQVYVVPHRLDRDTFVGTLSIFFALSNVLKVGPYFALGQLSPVNMTTALALLPLAVAANFGGVWLVRRTPVGVFYKVTYILMFLVGLELVREGVVALLRN